MRGLEARVQMALHTVYFCIGLTALAAKALLAAQGLAYEEGERALTKEGAQIPPLIADDSQLTHAYLQALLTRQEETTSVSGSVGSAVSSSKPLHRYKRDFPQSQHPAGLT